MFSCYDNYLSRLSPSQTRMLPCVKSNTLDFSSNDYLGLSRHPLLMERAASWALRHGAGSRASRLVAGNHLDYEAVEEKLAALKHTEAALVISSGYQANSAVLAALLNPALFAKPPLVLADKLNHASLLHGVRLSGARQIRYAHNNLDHLEALLKKYTLQGNPLFVLTESVFSMDGNEADIPHLLHLKKQYPFFLYIDDAHGSGMLGQNGMGKTSDFGGQIDMIMGTFGKALGGFGAYIACSHTLKKYLLQTCGGVIYSTALPPMVWGAMDASLELVPTLSQERAHALHLAKMLRTGLQQQGYNTGNSTTHIVPLIIGDAAKALDVAQHLREKNIAAIAIRPPTVPPNTSRLRLAVKATHTEEDVQILLAALTDIKAC